MTALSLGAATDIGRTRSVNQDEALTSTNFAAVADGMGGHQGGEVASELALRSLSSINSLSTLDDLRVAVSRANRVVYSRAQERADLRGMGTTLCALALLDPGTSDEQIAIVNVGDSRVYRFRGGELLQETEDHNLVQTLVRDGRIRADEADTHPQRNIVTRVIGVDPDVEIDGFTHQAVLGDRYLLCSDGLHGELSRDAIAELLQTLDDPGEAARELVRQANDHGGRDNITCVVVDVVDGDATDAAPFLLRSGVTPDIEGPDHTDVFPAVSMADPDQTLTIGDLPRPGTSESGASEALGLAGAGAVGLATAKTASARRSKVASTGSGTRSSGTRPDVPMTVDLAGESELRPLRRFTWRVVAFMVAVGVVLGAAAGAVIYFAGNSYYVGTDADEVVIFQGRPDGLLWLDPSVSERTGIQLDELAPVLVESVREPGTISDLDGARERVDRLRERQTEFDDASAEGG